MDRVEKLELIKRSLGLRHKLKVHESMKPPETHEELAVMLLAKWEFEDELRAIEEILAGERAKNVALKRAKAEKTPVVPPGLTEPGSRDASDKAASGAISATEDDDEDDEDDDGGSSPRAVARRKTRR
jgi:hypothetical protein